MLNAASCSAKDTAQLRMQTELWQGWKVKAVRSQFVWEAEACFWGKVCSPSCYSEHITTFGSLWILLKVLNHTAKHLI